MSHAHAGSHAHYPYCPRVNMPKRKASSVLDFPKKKRKLGKGKAVPENATNLTFKAKSVIVPGQLEKSVGPKTHRQLGLQVYL